MRQKELLFNLIKSYLLSSKYTEEVPAEELAEVLNLMQRHRIGHLAGVVLFGCPTYQPWEEVFFGIQCAAMMQYEKSQYTKERVFKAFETHEIPYLPLKGSVIASLYEEPWHRTSCDVDILIPETRLEDAVSILQEELGFNFQKRSEHDISLSSTNGITIELHFDLHEDSLRVSEIWEDAVPVEGGYRYKNTDEMVMLYHLAHMAKHFVNGGCGIRPFVDLWLMRQGLSYDAEKLDTMLTEHGLKKFSETMFRLLDVWFGENSSNEILDEITEYLLNGDAYGSVENVIAISRQKGESGFRYMFFRIFQPYDILRYGYPILEKYRFLLPFCQVHRWVRLLFTRFGRFQNEIKANNRVDSEKERSVRRILQALDLSDK